MRYRSYLNVKGIVNKSALSRVNTTFIYEYGDSTGPKKTEIYHCKYWKHDTALLTLNI